MTITSPEAAPPTGEPPRPDDVAPLVADGDYGVYRLALQRGQVTFHHVAGAWFHLCDPALAAEQRKRFEALFPQLLDTFAEPRGGIITSYFCRNIRVAAALTDIPKAAELPESVPVAEHHRPAGDAADGAPAEEESRRDGAGNGTNGANGANGASGASGGYGAKGGARGSARNGRADRVHHALDALRSPINAPSASSSAIHVEPTFGDPEDWQAKRILFACLDLHYRALEFLTPKPRKICMRLTFGVISSLLGTLDSRRAPGADCPPFAADPAELECLERELVRAERYYSRSAQRTAQLEYFTGMLVIGLPVLALAIAAVVLISGAALLQEPMLVSLFAGGVGAIVSVMNRMTSGRLILVAESGKSIIRLLGAIRPLIGAVLGLAIYVLLSAELVSFTAPPEEGRDVLLAAGLGFIAGFSERFAQDMIAGAAGGQTSGPATAAVQPETPAAASPQLRAGV